MGWKQGKFTLKHPEKYMGDPDKVEFKSSWELEMHEFLDLNPNVLRWISEPKWGIKYLSPNDNRMHEYWPDYYVEVRTKDGTIRKELIEIKPIKQMKPPTRGGKSKKVQIQEAMTYAVNVQKWKAASIFAAKAGIKFKLLPETVMYKGK